MTNLEALRLGMATEGPRAGWQDTIGAAIVEVEEGRVVVELEAEARHRHQGGVVQGGIVTAVADAAMGMSLLTMQESGYSNSTIELKINFIRPVVEGRLRAEGRVVKMGKSLLFSEARVYNQEGKLVALASSTCLAIPRRFSK